MRASPPKSVRCAIYTRVSTEQGLEQDFNSLDAQYDASQAYVRSQAHAGWTMLRAMCGRLRVGTRAPPTKPARCSASRCTSA
jgi:hypothetical protein